MEDRPENQTAHPIDTLWKFRAEQAQWSQHNFNRLISKTRINRTNLRHPILRNIAQFEGICWQVWNEVRTVVWLVQLEVSWSSDRLMVSDHLSPAVFQLGGGSMAVAEGGGVCLQSSVAGWSLKHEGITKQVQWNPPPTQGALQCSMKNGQFSIVCTVLHSAALCVNTQTDNSGFHYLTLPRRVFTHGAAAQHSANNGEISIFCPVLRCNTPCMGRALRYVMCAACCLCALCGRGIIFHFSCWAVLQCALCGRGVTLTLSLGNRMESHKL